jgi:vanillate O-demethylase monooxygenase subunit
MAYPFATGLTYMKDAWYLAGWKSDFGETPIQRWILGEPVALYRANDGTPVALNDRCAHRGYPLTAGKRVGDSLQCGYHGWEFDCAGKCTKMPSQDRVPPAVRVRSYPLIERWNFVWIWMGDPALADPDLLPDHDSIGVTHPHFGADVGGVFLVDARYQLVNENLLDLSHLNYVHPGTVGTDAVTRAPVTTEIDRERGLITARRRMHDTATPFYQRVFGVPEGAPLARRQAAVFFAPSIHITKVHLNSAATPEAEYGDPGYYGEMNVIHGITPATATTTHYFWAIARTRFLDDEMTQFLFPGIRRVMGQDEVALRDQEAMIASLQEPMREFHCAADEAALASRRYIAERMQAERARAQAGAPVTLKMPALS